MIEANIDYLVLGCSHYPYLIPQIKYCSGSYPDIDSGRAVAKQTQNILREQSGSLQQLQTKLHFTPTRKYLRNLENKYPVIEKIFYIFKLVLKPTGYIVVV
jgi:glutamate racemase